MSKYFLELGKGTWRSPQKTSHCNRFQIKRLEETDGRLDFHINYFGKPKRVPVDTQRPLTNMLFYDSTGTPVDLKTVKKEFIVESKEQLLTEIQAYVTYKEAPNGTLIRFDAGEGHVDILVAIPTDEEGESSAIDSWSKNTWDIDGNSDDEEVISYVKSVMRPQLRAAERVFRRFASQ